MVEQLDVLQAKMEATMNEALKEMPDLGWTMIIALPVSEKEIHTWCSNTLDPMFLTEVLNNSASRGLDKPQMVS